MTLSFRASGLAVLTALGLLAAPAALTPAQAADRYGTIRDVAPPGVSPGVFGGAYRDYGNVGRGTDRGYDSYQRYQDRTDLRTRQREVLRQNRDLSNRPAVEAGRLRDRLYPQTRDLDNLSGDGLTSKQRLQVNPEIVEGSRIQTPSYAERRNHVGAPTGLERDFDYIERHTR